MKVRSNFRRELKENAEAAVASIPPLVRGCKWDRLAREALAAGDHSYALEYAEAAIDFAHGMETAP